MMFYDVLEQIIALLKRHGRLSYRALKRQFNLDDAYLADLKAEIIDIQQLAVDQDGMMLVWAGELPLHRRVGQSKRQLQPSPLPQTALQADALAEGHVGLVDPSTNAATPEAERRHLTVMFCDLVGSTALSSQLDPEDLRSIILAYQQACTEIVQRFEGHIAQHLGDGLLVYFGYPQAHEDAMQWAIRAGLEIVQTIKTLDTPPFREHGVQLAVRVGIHTGLVVVGEVGGRDRQEQLALGETPNIAAHLQKIAEPNTVVISVALQQLVQGYFVCQELGPLPLPGIALPMQVYRVLHESGAQSRFDVVARRGFTPLVGREEEMQLLLERWKQAQEGTGQVVLLNGEAGIGKSRLVEALKGQLAGEAAKRIESRCSPYDQHSALHPIIACLQRDLAWDKADHPSERLHRLEAALEQLPTPQAEAVPLLAHLLSLPLPETYSPLTLTPQRQKLADGCDMAFLSKRLATIARDAPVRCEVAALRKFS